MAVRIIVCGGRNFNDRRAVYRVLDHIHTHRSIREIIQGDGPTGADRWAREWAINCGQTLTGYQLGGTKNTRYPEQMRARQMLKDLPDGLVAFPGHGECIALIAAARAAGVPIYMPFG
ncbi:MAG: DUF2493 domain-containing protein [Halopseudomonas sp.]|uniref:DUF2493 domain-containing protein n=1 Tax=Halopseudomonas sp. TaxID=2901191 RepID=UPI00300135AC